ncbi:hypothetical protein LBMAG48_04240 [Phycisphaerae bacterium]|nr:hypothetical protein LBMAG48_04240 [Phycisphaerae bacterium]
MKTAILPVLVLLAAASSANAWIVPVTRRSGITVQDSLNWNQFANWEWITTNNTRSASTANGMGVALSSNGWTRRYQQGNNYFGGFAGGDALLYQTAYPSHQRIDFSEPVQAFTVQVSAGFGSGGNPYGGQYIANVRVYDTLNNLLADYSSPTWRMYDTFGGILTPPVMGAFSSERNIGRVDIGVTLGGGGGSMINRVDLFIPAPGTAAVLGLAGLVAARRRRV